MQLHFPNTTRAKKAAKHLAAELSASLSSAQRAIARGCGYRDWHEFESQAPNGPAFSLDQYLPMEAYVERQTSLILKIADDLAVPDGDVQYALAGTRLTGDRPIRLVEQIAIRVGCWRAGDLPLTGKRELGAAGVLKTTGRNGERAIVKRFGHPTQVLTNGGFLTIADFEFVSPRASVDLFIPQRLFLPYGCWTEADGASVLFSRDYLPLWRLRDGKPPERVESWLWIKFVKQEWFFRDGEEPWANRAAEAAAMGLLNERGLHRLPMSADALPLVLRNPSAHNIHDGADLLRDLRTSPAKRIGEHVGDAIQHLN